MKKPHVTCAVGRLLEIRLDPLNSVEAVAAASVAIGQAVRTAFSAPERSAIVCVDWRWLRVLSPEVAEALTEAMRSGNARVLRSAALISTQATIGLQLERLIRAANHPARRAFREAEELLAWLGEVMTPEEQQRARAFLAEGEPLLSAEPSSRRAAP